MDDDIYFDDKWLISTIFFINLKDEKVKLNKRESWERSKCDKSRDLECKTFIYMPFWLTGLSYRKKIKERQKE